MEGTASKKIRNGKYFLILPLHIKKQLLPGKPKYSAGKGKTTFFKSFRPLIGHFITCFNPDKPENHRLKRKKQNSALFSFQNWKVILFCYLRILLNSVLDFLTSVL